MDYWQKKRSKEVSKEQYLVIYLKSSSFAVYMYVRSNRPVKLKCLPHLDPLMGVRSTSAGYYCQSKCRTRLISYWMLTKTSLDHMEY